MPSRFAPFAVAVGLLIAAGCGPAKLNETKTLKLDKDTMAAGLSLPAQPKPQTLTVEFSSSEGEVTVGLFKKDDVKTDDDMAVAPLGKALAHKKGKSESFTVDVPENTATRVIARGHTAAKTDVTVKVTNAK